MKCPHCGVSIDEHEASLCLNAWVAETVMDCGKVGVCFMLNDKRPSESFTTSNHPLRYSIDIAAAWEVAKLRGISVIPTHTGWLAGRFDLDQEFLDPDTGIIDGHFSQGYSGATTAQLAICRAALKAVGA